jgi:hypothetical protein
MKKFCNDLENAHFEFELALQKDKITFDRLDDFIILSNIDQLCSEIKGFKKELDK